MSTQQRTSLYKVIVLIGFAGLLAACSTFDPPKHIDTQDWHTAMREVVTEYAPVIEPRLIPYFQRAGIEYPPTSATLLTFKYERRMELWARGHGTPWRFVKDYSLQASSGGPGPKLREADRQIPEGIYNIVELNPFSRLRLSMKLNYPNDFDMYHARQEGRSDLGGDIFIHGDKLSVGCLAIGDSSIDELFVLAAKTGIENIRVIIAPNDLRLHSPLNMDHDTPSWISALDDKLESALIPFKV